MDYQSLAPCILFAVLTGIIPAHRAMSKFLEQQGVVSPILYTLRLLSIPSLSSITG